MADATLQIGNGNWAVKPSLLLGYNVDVNGYNPIEMAVSRGTSGSRTNALGIIDYKDSNIARINYTSGVGSLLLEPQRTNLLLNTVWAGGSSTPTSWNAGTLTGTSTPVASIKNPNVTAYRFTTSNSRQEINQQFTIALNSVNCLSVYVESVITTVTVNQMLRFSAITGTGTSVFLKNNVVISATTNIEAGNTYTLQFTCTLSDVFQVRIGSGSSGNTTSDFTLSMPQLEVGSYSTSYIPTTTTTVTRNADILSKNNIYTNGYITSAGGTWYVELNNNIAYIRDTGARGISISDTIGDFTGNAFYIRSGGATSQRLTITKYIASVASIFYLTTTDIVKIAIKWNGVTADIFINGIKVVSATAFTTTNMEYLIGNGADAPKYIKSTALYSTPISDAECIALTTL